MESDDEARWRKYFQGIFQGGTPWLNYPNAQCQAQTWSLALEAAGPVSELRCLDVGCGRGDLSVILASMGASVVGLDFVEDPQRASRNSEIRWVTRGLDDPSLGAALGTFDRVFALEVLQYSEFARGLRTMWSMLKPGGRMVVTVPNRECPIIAKVMARFEGKYVAPSPQEISEAIESLEGVAFWGGRGVAFQTDQRIAPYVASPWSTELRWPQPPNRILLVATKT